MRTIIVILLFCAMFSQISNSQTWRKRINTSSNGTYYYNLFETSDKGYLCLVYNNLQNTNNGVVKLDENGNIETFMIQGIDTNLTCLFAFEYSNNYFFILNRFIFPFDTVLYFIKTDYSGNILFNNIIVNNNTGYSDLIQCSDTTLMLIGSKTINNPPSYYQSTNILKIDYNGNKIWEKNWGGYDWVNTNSIVEVKNEGYLITGAISDFELFTSDLLLLKIDNNGDSVWTKTFGGENTEEGNKIISINDSTFAICGYTSSFGNGLEDVWLLKVNANGDSLVSYTYGTEYNDFGFSIQKTQDNGFILIGSTNDSDSYGEPYALKINSSGTIIWERTFKTSQINNVTTPWPFRKLIKTHNNYYVGMISDTLVVDVIKFDENGYLRTNELSGYVFKDKNENCVLDSDEFGYQDNIVSACTTNYCQYTNTDYNGYYIFNLDSGNYTISATVPSNYWLSACSPNNYNVNITSDDTLENFNFAINSNLCPKLQVDIGSYTYERCFNNSITVKYKNTGSEIAQNSYIKVTLNDYVIPFYSYPQWESYQNNELIYNLGSLDVGFEGVIQIYDSVSCNAELGQTLCIEAHIYPDTLCEISNPQWDKSSISITASCVGDSLVCFTIYNTGEAGNGNMQGTSTYRLFEDNALAQTGTFQLAGGDSLVLCYTANGKTLRLEADQRPGHPGNSHPNASIELCGNSANPSLGYITQFPEDDEDAFVEIDCQEVVGSYDPNEKLVKPKGITSEKYIPNGTQLEYQINFQNTGTDTAFLVVIRDTLSQYLNVETIEFGVTSHTATYKLYGNGIIEWTFNNIMLPDSNVNEAESHGFVKYKIRLKQDLENGTLIENRAGIIFDFNAPIITNFALNKVYDTTLVVTIPIKEQINYKRFSVFPNPASSQINISTNNEIIEFIELYNELGVKIDEIVVKNNITSFIYINKQKMSGLYFLKVKTKENIYTGKIVFK